MFKDLRLCKVFIVFKKQNEQRQETTTLATWDANALNAIYDATFYANDGLITTAYASKYDANDAYDAVVLAL